MGFISFLDAFCGEARIVIFVIAFTNLWHYFQPKF